MIRVLDDSGPNSVIGVLWEIPLTMSFLLIPPHAALLALYMGGKSAEINAQCVHILPTCKLQKINEHFKECCGKYNCFNSSLCDLVIIYLRVY